MRYNFNYKWHYKLADAFPLAEALEKWKDAEGRFFYEVEYGENDWQEATIPHTFNDVDLFRDRIQDAGSGQKRTFAFYRKWFRLPKGSQGKKIFIEFEGLRQTCYLYVNGKMAGYYEAGVAPFGFDLTPFIDYSDKNLIAVATDNTSAREIPFCIAETPPYADVEPGSYFWEQDAAVEPEHRGVGFSWNCNDFNPSVGGISRPVYLHIKPMTYLTLPLYSNLRTGGITIWGEGYDLKKRTAEIKIRAEVRNEGQEEAEAFLRVSVDRLDDGQRICSFEGKRKKLFPAGEIPHRLSIVPEDAYVEEILENGKKHYREALEEQTAPTPLESLKADVLDASSGRIKLRFWEPEDPYLYRVVTELVVNGKTVDYEEIQTGFRKIDYDQNRGILINGRAVWLTGYAQRASNEWAAIGIAPEWMKDMDAELLRESGANHIRWMHVAASPADIRSCDRHGIVCTQPAGDKEMENFGRKWDQRVELMRDVIIYFRNHPSIFFWEAGNNSINKEHMREMRLLKEKLDPNGERFMGCRTINTEDVVLESEYVGTMLNRHAARFFAEHGPVTETEYSREEAPRRIWDDDTPPYYDYPNRYLGLGGKKKKGLDYYDLTMEELIIKEAQGYSEFFHDRIGGASGKNLYSAAAGLCWTDSAQHGRQAFSENARMSGRVDPIRIKKQNFRLYQAMQSEDPVVKIIGHWNYPPMTEDNYRFPLKRFNGEYWEENGKYGKRDPLHKTVYVAASYPVMYVKLWINGHLAGVSKKPLHTFLFPFPDINVTENGRITAVGYNEEGKETAKDTIETAGEPTEVKAEIHVSPSGFLADGNDIAFVDLEIVDKQGRRCPLSNVRIDFETDGPVKFLGGYNSGRFDGWGRNDSVIHKPYVYAECGCNRVFLRSSFQPGEIVLKIKASRLPEKILRWESQPAECAALSRNLPEVCMSPYGKEVPYGLSDGFCAIPSADRLKYVPVNQDICKILVDGQEPDTRGVSSVNRNGSIWGAILCVLERMYPWDGNLQYDYDCERQKLTVVSRGTRIEATAGESHLLVNGKENLMDGAPYVNDMGILVMEVNAVIPHIAGTVCQYDERVQVLRIERRGDI